MKPFVICTDCKETFRHYPIESSHVRSRLIHFKMFLELHYRQKILVKMRLSLVSSMFWILISSIALSDVCNSTKRSSELMKVEQQGETVCSTFDIQIYLVDEIPAL